MLEKLAFDEKKTSKTKTKNKNRGNSLTSNLLSKPIKGSHSRAKNIFVFFLL